MNKIEELEMRIIEEITDAETHMDSPAKEDGVWWLNINYKKGSLAIAWSPFRGFGVSSLPSEGFGCGPDEVYQEFEEVVVRVVELIREGMRTQSPSIRTITVENTTDEL